jgi:hypothetical protein
MARNAVLAIIADGGQAIVVIYTEGEETNYSLLYFMGHLSSYLHL